MATATPARQPSTSTASPTRALHLWHLLSLDAPTVAALWTWFIAQVNHTPLPAASILAMAIAVWMLYAADRLMDARILDAAPYQGAHADLEARHYFHRRHRSLFLPGILLACVFLTILLPRLDPQAIHLYLILGSLLAGYFILIHATPGSTTGKFSHRLPKEIAVGIFFAAAIFIPTCARHPELRLALLPPALLFAALCSLNCLFIYAWEHPNPSHEHPAHPATRIALQHLTGLTACIPPLAAAILFWPADRRQWPISLACALSASLFLALHHQRRNLAPLTLRAAADLSLATPLLLLFLPHR